MLPAPADPSGPPRAPGTPPEPVEGPRRGRPSEDADHVVALRRAQGAFPQRERVAGAGTDGKGDELRPTGSLLVHDAEG
ncbi:hypothetical protein GCM10022197_12500 [Microlunatus spumicola]|uniref:Uncharacterized protein n=1 Tax=Microlunatus spumicola TaxID=81499 RepID=A0ABP6X2W2_9ACTN